MNIILPEAAKEAMVERFKRAPFPDKATAEMLAVAAVAHGVTWHEAFMASTRVLPFLVCVRRRRAPRPEDRPRLRWNHLAGSWRETETIR